VNLETQAEILVPRPPEEVFDFATADGTFEKVLRPLGPIPGIVNVTVDGGSPLVRGSKRSITMTDKSVLREEVLVLDRPREYRYRWLNRPAPPFSFLVKGGETSWTFLPEGTGTRIRWNYAFELTSPVAYPAMVLVTMFFRRWMKQGLEGVREGVAGSAR
jgi:hypothetical protein